jgi:hypothetical protein
MEYVEPDPTTRSEFLRALATGTGPEVAQALVGVVFTDPDWQWLQDKCLALLRHHDVIVRGAALTSLGHIARIHGALDRGKVEPEIKRLVDDPDLGGRALDALSDIDVFLGRRRL